MRIPQLRTPQQTCRAIILFSCFAAIGLLGNIAYATELETETIILRFEENNLLAMPSVIAGFIHVETDTGTVVIEDFSGVLMLEHGVKYSFGPPPVEGPYRVTILASEFQQLQVPPTTPIPLVDYILPDDPHGEVAGENVKAWFPANKAAFCSNSQAYWHLRAAVTLSDTVRGDICTTPRNWFEFDRDADMPQAWAITHGSPDVLVAVLDTGFDWKHPEFGADLPPYSCTTAESLYYFSNSVFYTNPNDAIGDASSDSIAVPGLPGIDDDGDGLIDEDSVGRSYFNDAESDVVTGEVDDVTGTTIFDYSASWQQNSLVDRFLYLYKPGLLSDRVRIISNTSVSVTTDTLHFGVPPNTGQLFDWSVFFDQGSSFRIGDGINNNEIFPDQWIDDVGWLNDLPNDDDENGAEDDVHGYDFTNLASPDTQSYHCEGEDYWDPDNDVFTNGSHGSGMVTQIATSLTNGMLMGAAPNVKILPVRVGSHTWDYRADRCDYGSVGDMALATGIRYAMTFNPDIIVSAKASSNDSTLLDAIQDAVDAGAIYINGAGNSNGFRSEHWLDPIDPVVVVGGTDQWDGFWKDSVGGSTIGPFVTVSARAAALRIAVPWGAAMTLNRVHHLPARLLRALPPW